MDSAIFRTFAQGAIAAALVAWSAGLVVAGEQAPAPAAPASVFTVKQATEGRAAYTKSCASCHMPDLSGNNEIPPLAGTAFMSTWGTRSTKELFDYMSAAMPYGGPSLSTETYTVIAAYILQSNGAVAGADALSTSTAMPIESLVRAPGTKE